LRIMCHMLCDMLCDMLVRLVALHCAMLGFRLSLFSVLGLVMLRKSGSSGEAYYQESSTRGRHVLRPSSAFASSPNT